MVTLSEAKQILDAAEAKATTLGVKVAIVVLDAGGNTIALHRMDDAYLSAVAVATAKAYSALNFGKPTHMMAEAVSPASQAGVAAIDGRLTFIKGGVPILDESGRRVGGVGVSGATADQDLACAEAGLATLRR